MSTPDPLRSDGLTVRVQVLHASTADWPRWTALDPLLTGKPAPLQPGFTAARRDRRQPTGARRDDLCRRTTRSAVAAALADVVVRAGVLRHRQAQSRRGYDRRRRRRDGVAVPRRHRVGWLLAAAGGVPPRWRRPASWSGCAPWSSECCCAGPHPRAPPSASWWWPSLSTAVLLLGWRVGAAALRREPLSPDRRRIRFRLRRSRHRQRGAQPAERAVGQLDAAAVQRRLLRHQRQAQPGTAGRRGAAAGEPAEHDLVFLGGQPAAVVVDDDGASPWSHRGCAASTILVAPPCATALRTRLSTASRSPPGQPQIVPMSSSASHHDLDRLAGARVLPRHPVEHVGDVDELRGPRPARAAPTRAGRAR